MDEFLSAFKADPTQTSFKFDKYLTRPQREEVHAICDRIKLYHRSYGLGTARRITVSKEKMDIEITDDDRKMFIKDSALPISVYKEPWFSQQIEAIDPICGSKKCYASFLEACKVLAIDGKSFKTYCYELKDKMVNFIKEQPRYKELSTDDLKMKPTELPNQTDIYINNNFTKTNWSNVRYISLDINKANFTCIYKFFPEIFDGCKTWAEFVRKFSSIEYFTTAKYFRQIVFGNLNTKRIASIEKFIMSELYQMMKDVVNIIGCCGSDEMIIATDVDNLNQTVTFLTELFNEHKLDSIWRIEPFILKPLGNSKVFIKTRTDTGIIEIKGIEKDFFLQAYRYIMNNDVIEIDRMGMKDSYVVRYEDLYEFD